MTHNAPTPAIRESMTQMVHDAQEAICGALAQLDGNPFVKDTWKRESGGGGTTCVLQNGAVFEKAGVGVSVVHGPLSREAAMHMRQNHAGLRTDSDALRFFAAGISLVIHPHNPFAPTAHANYRYFEVEDAGEPQSWWFGGGADLTPSYLFEDDAKHFHMVHKTACDAFDPAYYPRFKQACDDYFHIAHRGERRGVGGIFFDDLNDRSSHELLEFSRRCAGSFVEAYVPLVAKRCNTQASPEHKQWQALRRGRYVEFNLMYDRGTLFGLRTGGRVESILMSLPVHASWLYNHEPAAGSPEAALLDVLKKPRQWV